MIIKTLFQEATDLASSQKKKLKGEISYELEIVMRISVFCVF